MTNVVFVVLVSSIPKRATPNGIPSVKNQSIFSLARHLALWAATLTPAAALATPADSAPDQGEIAAKIRSAGHPCNHVVAVASAGTQAWLAKCNSGNFLVAIDPDGNFTVTQTD